MIVREPVIVVFWAAIQKSIPGKGRKADSITRSKGAASWNDEDTALNCGQENTKKCTSLK